jgi:hypothetical protein
MRRLSIMAEPIVGDVGPIDYALIEFPDQDPTGEVAAALIELVDSGIVRVYDILAIRKDANGSVSGFEVSDLGPEGASTFAVFAGARSGLIDDEDVAEAAGIMEPGTVAVLVVYENTWAIPFVNAAAGAGGQLVASGRIPIESVLEALDVLEATS